MGRGASNEYNLHSRVGWRTAVTGPECASKKTTKMLCTLPKSQDLESACVMEIDQDLPSGKGAETGGLLLFPATSMRTSL